jgi:hypothetical protein
MQILLNLCVFVWNSCYTVLKNLWINFNDIIATPPVLRFAKGRIIITSSEGATLSRCDKVTAQDVTCQRDCSKSSINSRNFKHVRAFVWDNTIENHFSWKVLIVLFLKYRSFHLKTGHVAVSPSVMQGLGDLSLFCVLHPACNDLLIWITSVIMSFLLMLVYFFLDMLLSYYFFPMIGLYQC